jgi:hypothetical protein
MPCDKSARTGDACGLELLDCLPECGEAGRMRAIGASARDQIDMTVEQKGRAFSLHRSRQRLCTIDPCPFVGPGKAQKDGGDIAGVEGGC